MAYGVDQGLQTVCEIDHVRGQQEAVAAGLRVKLAPLKLLDSHSLLHVVEHTVLSDESEALGTHVRDAHLASRLEQPLGKHPCEASASSKLQDRRMVPAATQGRILRPSRLDTCLF